MLLGRTPRSGFTSQTLHFRFARSSRLTVWVEVSSCLRRSPSLRSFKPSPSYTAISLDGIEGEGWIVLSRRAFFSSFPSLSYSVNQLPASSCQPLETNRSGTDEPRSSAHGSASVSHHSHALFAEACQPAWPSPPARVGSASMWDVSKSTDRRVERLLSCPLLKLRSIPRGASHLVL